MLPDDIHADVRGHAGLTQVLSAIGGALTGAAVLAALGWAVLRDDVLDRLIGASIFLALAGAMSLVLRRVLRGPAWYRRATWVFRKVAPVTVHVEIVTQRTVNHSTMYGLVVTVPQADGSRRTLPMFPVVPGAGGVGPERVDAAALAWIDPLGGPIVVKTSAGLFWPMLPT
jgi:hypothetical protein